MDVPIKSFQLHTGEFPQSLEDLVSNPGLGDKWRGPYTSRDFVDPWGNPYLYCYPSKKNQNGDFDFWSAGPDGQSGTADDIGNW